MRSFPKLRPPVVPALLFLLSSLPSAATPPAPEGPSPVRLADVGSGQLLRRGPAGLEPLPVLDLQVRLEVSGIMVRGTITQSFRNPTADVIEALYAFPLPEGAAVHRMEMQIGPDRIVAVIREKEEARRTYVQAKAEGKKASLAEQVRPNLFTTSAANINPGETVHVVLEYLQELAWDDGEFRLAFPLTFTPRAGAGGPDHGAGSWQGAAPAFADAVPRARVVARVRPGVPLENGDVFSPSHGIVTRWEGDDLVVETEESTVAADRDFRLAWRPQRGWEPSGAVFAEERQDGRYLLIMLVPPGEPHGAGPLLPTETLFIVDTSGSMQGGSMARAREALVAALDRLRPGDAFNILAFDDELVEYAPGFVPAGPAAVSAAQRWVSSLRADGGTRIDRALSRGIDLTRGPEGEAIRRMVFLTDGAVGNEEEILRDVLARLGSVRLHALGIGPAPNRFLLRKMASHGRGLCDFIAEGGDGNGVDRFLSRLDRPVLADLRLRWGGAAPEEVYPAILPDLHAGEPLFLSARMRPGTSPAGVTLAGITAAGPVELELAVPADAPEDSGIATRWARARVDSLMDAMHAGADPEVVRREVVDVSLAFGIVSRYTSLVAVEEISTAEGDAIPVRLSPGPPGAVLPRGGTMDRLWLRAALVLAAAGAFLLLARPRG